MVGSLIWLLTAGGFGWTAYYCSRLVAYTGWAILVAQAPVPEFRVQDWANLGGFALFAGAMYWMHREAVRNFREDLRDERTLREKQAAAIVDNTNATRTLTEHLRSH